MNSAKNNMYTDLYNSLNFIKDICKEHVACISCPLSYREFVDGEELVMCGILKSEPWKWDFDYLEYYY